MVWVQGGGHPAAEAPSPPSPVLGAFVFRNLARPVALSNTSSALGGGRAPAQDTLCAVAAGRLPKAAGQQTPGGGGAKSTGKASVSSFMVSTLLMCVPRMHACVPRMRGAQGTGKASVPSFVVSTAIKSTQISSHSCLSLSAQALVCDHVPHQL